MQRSPGVLREVNWGFVFIILFTLAFWTAVARAQVPGSGGVGGMLIQRDRIVEVDTMQLFQYPAPQIYGQWMTEMQHCTGLKSERTITPNDISWISVPGDAFTVHGQGPVPGWTVLEHNNVLLLEKYVMNERLVKHEMAHILQGVEALSRNHTEEWWLRCELIA